MTKLALLAAARARLQVSADTLRAQLEQLDTAAAEDTKSSAGDKFETGRERLQQERDRLTAQLHTTRQQLTALEVAGRAVPATHVGPGAFVQLAGGEAYLIATGLGKVRVGEEVGYVISAASPVGAALLGATAGQAVPFRGRVLDVSTVS